MIGSLREIQWLGFFKNLSRSSSRPLIRISVAIGVNKPKKIIPSIIGLINRPRRYPNRIHSLLSGNRISALIVDIIRNVNDANPKVYAHKADEAL